MPQMTVTKTQIETAVGEASTALSNAATADAKAEAAQADINTINSKKPKSTTQTLVDAVALASTLSEGDVVETVEYNSGTGIGGSTYTLLNVGNSGARPDQNGGSIVHVGLDGLYLKSVNDYPSITQFGALLDGTDSTAAIDNFMTFSFSFNSGSGISGQFEGTPQINLPKGTLRYSGTGFVATADTSKGFAIVGQGQNQTFLVIDSDVYFITQLDVNSIRITDMQVSGGKGFFVSTNTATLARQVIQVERFTHRGFTQCSIGNNSNDLPFVFVKECRFEGDPATTNICVALSGLTDQSVIENNAFLDYGYAIKLGKGGNNTKIRNNFLQVRTLQLAD